MMKSASFGQRARIMSATCRSAIRAAAWSGCWNDADRELLHSDLAALEELLDRDDGDRRCL
jgi:hypothetical protein